MEREVKGIAAPDIFGAAQPFPVAVEYPFARALRRVAEHPQCTYPNLALLWGRDRHRDNMAPRLRYRLSNRRVSSQE